MNRMTGVGLKLKITTYVLNDRDLLGTFELPCQLLTNWVYSVGIWS